MRAVPHGWYPDPAKRRSKPTTSSRPDIRCMSGKTTSSVNAPNGPDCVNRSASKKQSARRSASRISSQNRERIRGATNGSAVGKTRTPTPYTCSRMAATPKYGRLSRPANVNCSICRSIRWSLPEAVYRKMVWIRGWSPATNSRWVGRHSTAKAG